MTGFWTNQLNRFSQWGVLRTLGYYVFAVGADKVGVGIWLAFEYAGHSNAFPRTEAATFSILESMSELTARDRELLRACQGGTRLELYRGYFDRGKKCAVARLEGSELACMLWMKTISEYCQNRGHRSVVLSDAITLPDHRGKGLYPQTLSFICDYATGMWGEAAKIYADCSVVNYASKRGLRKAGFVPNGWIVSVFGRSWHLRTSRTGKYSKTNDTSVG